MLEVTQYLRPNGEKKIVEVRDLRPEVEALADELGLIFSCEVLTTGQIAIYARLPHENEEDESLMLAENANGEYGPTKVLEKLIISYYKEDE